MKSLLVTSVMTTFVLALFFHSGNGLVCYKCPVTNCNTTETCKGGEDTCLIVYSGQNTSRCWKYSDCNIDFVSHYFNVRNFRYKCCQWNLCNESPIIVGRKIVLSGAFLLTIILYF